MSDVINGRQAVREAMRGRREVGVVWVSRRAKETLEWLPPTRGWRRPSGSTRSR